jgi:hypothetical protein
VWKRLKLLTLVVVTVLLAFVTYPTWRGLFAPAKSPTAWTQDDQIAVVVPEDSGYRVTIELFSGYQHGGLYHLIHQTEISSSSA